MISTPEEDAKVTLEQIKNQITLGELEVKRLRGLTAGEEYTLDEVIKAKEAHQASIVEAQTQLDSHNAEIAKLQTEIDTLSGMLKSGEAERDKYATEKEVALKAVEESNSTLESNKAELEKVKAEVAKTQADIESREKTLSAREEVFESNLAKIKEAVSEVKRV